MVSGKSLDIMAPTQEKSTTDSSYLPNSGSAEPLVNSPTGSLVIQDNSSTSVEENDQGGPCGFGSFKPKFLQKLRTPQWFLVFLCGAGFLQGFIVNGSVNVVITTLERRFQLSSTESGLIAGGYDIASFLCLIPVSYFGATRNKPRFIGAGVLVMSFGAFVFSLPHFLAGTYTFSKERDTGCHNTWNCSASYSAEASSANSFKWVLFLGQFLHGAGATPLYTLGCTYIEENVSTKVSALYLAIYYTMALIGPAIGYLLGGKFLRIYTDLNVDPTSLGLSPSSSVWVGAWWIGFVISAVIGIFVALPIMAFPKTLPGYLKIKSEKVSEMHKKLQNTKASQADFGRDVKDLPKSLYYLLTNPTFVFLSLAGASEGLLVSGLATFLPKVIESQFSIASSWAAVLVGLVTIPGAGGGTFLGGQIIKRFNLKCAGIIKLCVVSTFISLGLTFIFLIQCPQPEFFGLNTNLTESTETQFSFDCNIPCHCSTNQYDPICGTDNVIYYSPCFAGCEKTHNYKESKVYSECACVPHTGKNLTFDGETFIVQATREKCTTSCDLMPIFLLIVFSCMFCTFLVSMPSLSATLRCIPESQKSFGLGVQWLAVRIFGTIPAPLLFGSLIDLSCNLWQESCSKRGSCLAYDNRIMAINMLTLVSSVKALSFLFFLGASVCYKPPKSDLQTNQPPEISTIQKVSNGIT